MLLKVNVALDGFSNLSKIIVEPEATLFDVLDKIGRKIGRVIKSKDHLFVPNERRQLLEQMQGPDQMSETFFLQSIIIDNATLVKNLKTNELFVSNFRTSQALTSWLD